MNILLLLLLSIFILGATVSTPSWLLEGTNRQRWLTLVGLLLAAAGIVYVSIATSTHDLDESNRTTTLHKILKDADTVFYWDDNHQPCVLQGDQALVDRSAIVVKITNIHAGWTNGIFICSSSYTKLVPIDSPAEQTDE